MGDDIPLTDEVKTGEQQQRASRIEAGVQSGKIGHSFWIFLFTL
jgi:hypothetical protein